MTASRLLLLPALLALTAGTGCSDGMISGELSFQLNGDNFAAFEDVLYPRARASAWEEVLAPRGARVDFRVLYRTTSVSAIITQKGDLQITAHLSMGDVYDALRDEGRLEETYDYLNGDEYNAGLGTGDDGEPLEAGSRLYGEVVSGDEAAYGELDQDVRLVLLVNLPDDDGALSDEWRAEGAEYPKQLRANYSYTDEAGYHLPVEEVQLAALLIAGQEQFDADFDETAEHVDLVLDQFVHPEDAGDRDDPYTVGSVDITFTDSALASVGGTAALRAEFRVIVQEDPWALAQPATETEIGSEL